MESFIPEVTESTAIAKKVMAAHIGSLLDDYPTTIKVLSLDCFDTILWRRTATPVDVFFSLQHQPTFKSLGITALLRARLESEARGRKVIAEKKSEVTLRDIYRTGFPHLSETVLDQLAAEEIKAEIDACYAFPGLLALMREAHRRQLKIVIVSNTYFNRAQLTQLLSSTLPADVMQSISAIHCSSDVGRSKNNGLLKLVVEQLHVPPNAILHVGDDENADFNAAKKCQLHACHLLHLKNYLNQVTRSFSIAAKLFNHEVRQQIPLPAYFKGVFAQQSIKSEEAMLGQVALGPLLYSFGQFILHTRDRLKAQGKEPKVVFLMRDGHLPNQVCTALTGQPIGKQIRISRFAANAASFRSRADISRYVLELLRTNRFSDMSRQLLLPDEIVEPIKVLCSAATDPAGQFINLIQREDIENIILQKSALYRARLKRYLENTIDLKQDDTLMFVDLGYSGTTQKLLGPILKEELNVTIVGCYLIQLVVPGWMQQRHGLIDPSWCDERVMFALVAYIAILEQLCTCNESSVEDYSEAGEPIFGERMIAKEQQDKLDKIQQETLLFVKSAQRFFEQTGPIPIQALRENAVSELARLVFLPTEAELNYLKTFQFDVNLGTNDVVPIFDPETGLASLKKRGLFFSYMEKNKKTYRTNYPAELRAAGMELALTFIAQQRFGLQLMLEDMSFRRETISLAVQQGNEEIQTSIEASLTYDGYFALSLPISTGAFNVDVLFGQSYEWVQIESAEIISMSTYLKGTESLYTEDYWDRLHFIQMEKHSGRLFHCVNDKSVLRILPLESANTKKYLLRLVFRPVVKRG